MGVVSNLLAAVRSSLPTVEVIEHELSSLQEVLESTAVTLYALLTHRLVVYGVVLYALYRLFVFLFLPLSHLRRNPDVGYITSPRQSNAERANEVRRRRKTGDLPPVYPNGWYRLCDAHELPIKGVKQVHVLGKEFAVFRGVDGKVAVLDAYCPHLGANLAAGGTVDDKGLHCPFHGWAFDCTGKCTEIPYSTGKVPENAKVKAYTSLETNDQILLWFDAENREPFWYPPTLEHVNSGRWSYRGKTQHHINSHIQEVPENAADVAHLHYLHGPAILAGIDLRKTQDAYKFLRHGWEASWAPCTEEDKKHLSVLNLLHFVTVWGTRLALLDLRVTATQIGPGLVYLTWESLFGKGVFVQSLTPVEPLLQELTHNIYAEWTVPTVIAKFFLLGEASQVERDVMVWNNKMYRKQPMLVKEDKLILQHRRWYSQFYTENSPTFSYQKDTSEW